MVGLARIAKPQLSLLRQFSQVILLQRTVCAESSPAMCGVSSPICVETTPVCAEWLPVCVEYLDLARYPGLAWAVFESL